eukprot:10741503-Ditylum_brightwellii.AAC.1
MIQNDSNGGNFFGVVGVSMNTIMKMFWESQGKSCNKRKIYKNKPSTKLKRNKKNIEKMKE